MVYRNQLMTELMVPRDPVVASRIQGFYEAIEWNARCANDSEYFTYVNPQVSLGPPPTIAYWQTENQDKIDHFDTHDGNEPTIFVRGLRLPALHELVEVCLVVPTDDDVHAVFERGGKILDRHAHIKPRDHNGSQEFRFADPFNYSLRVTANPGWEIAAAADGRETEIGPEAKYDPKYVAWVWDEATGKEIPVVTKSNMHAFENEKRGNKHQAERLMNCLLRRYNFDRGMRPYILLTSSEDAIGLKLDQARTVIELLKSRTMKLNNLGTKGIALLEQYCDEIIPLSPDITVAN